LNSKVLKKNICQVLQAAMQIELYCLILIVINLKIMKQKYAFINNGIRNMLNGLGVPDRRAKAILPSASIEGKGTFVWRNSMTDGYKIG